MQLERGKSDYDVSDVVGLDKLESCVLNDQRSTLYTLTIIRWEDIVAARKNLAEETNNQKVETVPAYAALSPDRSTIAFWPTPNRDYLAHILYSTLHAL